MRTFSVAKEVINYVALTSLLDVNKVEETYLKLEMNLHSSYDDEMSLSLI